MTPPTNENEDELDVILIELAGKHGDPAYSPEARKAKASLERLQDKRVIEAQDELIGFVHRTGEHNVADGMRRYLGADRSKRRRYSIAQLQAKSNPQEGDKT